MTVTYVRGINHLGKASLSTAYGTVPRLVSATSGFLVPGHNVIYGGPSLAITADRVAVGTYRIHLPRQNWGLGQPAISVTPKGGSSRCAVRPEAPSSDRANFLVRCQNPAGTAEDSGFYFQYTVEQ